MKELEAHFHESARRTSCVDPATGVAGPGVPKPGPHAEFVPGGWFEGSLPSAVRGALLDEARSWTRILDGVATLEEDGIANPFPWRGHNLIEYESYPLATPAWLIVVALVRKQHEKYTEIVYHATLYSSGPFGRYSLCEGHLTGGVSPLVVGFPEGPVGPIVWLDGKKP